MYWGSLVGLVVSMVFFWMACKSVKLCESMDSESV